MIKETEEVGTLREITSDVEYEQFRIAVEGTKSRLQELYAEIADITAQMIDPERKASDDYATWRHRAFHAKNAKLKEAARLKNTVSQYNQLIQQYRTNAARQQREEKRIRALQHEAQKQETYRQIMPEVDHIRRLYAALCRVYRVTKLEVTEIDKQLLDHTHDYLIDQGAFEA